MKQTKYHPQKNGDYAFLLHIIRSLKSTGKGACILPHGVLFRGNVEAQIRKDIIQKGYIKGIIGLPANLFYGTGIPACIIVLDLVNAELSKHLSDDEKGIFMIDASKGFIKDGNKNRLREQDIHKIVDVFSKQLEISKFSRFVPYSEISDPKNDFNLNLPRYIDSQETEDIQDIEAHLLGGIPNIDIEALNEYWDVYPTLKNDLFSPSSRSNYSDLNISKDNVKQTIFGHPEFVSFIQEMDTLFSDWKTRNTKYLKELVIGIKPKETIHIISEDILKTYTGKKLINKYDVYQLLMNYWNDAMQDDCYLIAADGWKAEPYRILVKNKAGKETDKGWACDLVPKELVIERYFKADREAIEKLEGDKEIVIAQINELEEEHNTEEGYFSDYDKINKDIIKKRLKKIDLPLLKKDNADEVNVLKEYLKLTEEQSQLNKQIALAKVVLDRAVLAHYPTLSIDEIKQLVVVDKWMARIEESMKAEINNISQRLTQRIKELAERYENTLNEILEEVAELEAKVNVHLQSMGYLWN